MDAIAEVKQWLPTREKILHGRKSLFLFIDRYGKKPTPTAWRGPFREILRRHGIYTGPYSAVFRMFRKIFETEASPPERGISKAYVRFMMGYGVDPDDLDKLDVPGGVYDQAPHVHADAVEKEYEKLEQHINIYSGSKGEREGLGISKEDKETLVELLQKFKEGKIKIQ